MIGVSLVRKLWAILLMACLVLALPVQSIGAKASTSPKVTIKSYKTSNIKYAVIKGDKYKAANAKMYKEAKKAYAYQAELDELKANDIRDGYFMGTDYEIILTPKVKYKSSKKVSVLTEVYEYSGGVHGNIGYISYNTYKGKIVSLKKAFKSNTAYLNGKKYAKHKMLHNTADYPFADNKSTIAGHEFYYTSTGGVKVVFDPYELASFADGMKTVSIPKKYIK